MTELTDLSETDADNTLITGANVAENCPPSGINNAIRNVAGLIRRAFKASIFRLRDTADQTKLLAFDLSGIATATTRTITAPDANLDLTGWATGQIRFPAAQVPSANANTLDDYEEGTWVPVVTFATPGNLSVTYTVRNGTYTKVGRVVTAAFNITTATFTHSTASGAMLVTGLPFTSLGVTGSTGGGYLGGYTKANYTMVSAAVDLSSTQIRFIASGSGQVATGLTTGDVPTGGSVNLYFTVTYEAA